MLEKRQAVLEMLHPARDIFFGIERIFYTHQGLGLRHELHEPLGPRGLPPDSWRSTAWTSFSSTPYR